MSKNFVHLHLHTKYSMLDGACHVDQLVRRASELGMSAIAITDHGVMHGCIEFYQACKKANIKPIIGCEIYINGRTDLTNRDPRERYHHLVLLATNQEGYHNLMRISSIAHLEGYYYKPRIDKETLRKYSGGLIALAACIQGEVSWFIKEQQLEAAEKAAREYMDIFGPDNFFLELQDHGIEDQKVVNQGIREISRRTGLRAVVTNDVHYLHQSHAEAHEVMLCVQTSTVMSDPKRMRYPGNQFYFKSRAEMEERFPHDTAALDLTSEIAARCNLELTFTEGDSEELHFPIFETPPEFATQLDYLRHLGKAGLEKNYNFKFDNPTNEHEKMLVERFNYEVSIIESTGFINYFLVVSDFIIWARNNDVPVGPGRGSGAGSILAYSLGITQIDPIRFDLIFERFLNPERVSAPDFDIDFCQARREKVIEYVIDKYGADRVAQIVTFGQMGAKSVIRDVARALEIPLSKSNEFAKMIPNDPKTTLASAKGDNPLFDTACKTDPDLMRIMRYAEVLEGLCRNAGVHAAGVVIGDRPLIDIIPLGRGKEDMPVTQYDKDEIESCGLLKMDFLGLKTLTTLRESSDLIKQTHNIDIDVEKIPFDDPKTFGVFQRAETVGVFQLESGGMQRVLIDLQPTCIEEIIAILALYRPGPMDNIPDFVARKKGLKAITYDHPLLEPILKETYGIMVYQEQVQRAAQVLAGYSLGKADLLRRAMGKKSDEGMQRERQNFVEGCQKTNKIPAQQAERIFDNIAKFAGYGFNKAHAAAYGVIACQTAYMKAHYPVEFMSALISSEIGNFEKLPGLVMHAESIGIEVLLPSINHSQSRFAPEQGKIRYGLAGIRGVGEGAACSIIQEREANGEYTSLTDFCERVDSTTVNKRVLEALICCGAMDIFGIHRARLFHAIDFALARAAEKRREESSGQTNLFDMLDANDASTSSLIDLPDCTPWPQREDLAKERELLGVYMTGHPLSSYSTILRDLQTIKLEHIKYLPDNFDVRLTGMISNITRRIGKKDKKPWAVIDFDNGDISTEVLVFSNVYSKFEEVCQPDTAIVVCGSLSKPDDTGEINLLHEEEGENTKINFKIIAREIYPIDDTPRLFSTHLVARIAAEEQDTPQHLAELRKVVTANPGTVPLEINIVYKDGRRVVVATGQNYNIAPTPEVLIQLEKLLGSRNLRLRQREEVYHEARPARRWSGNRS